MTRWLLRRERLEPARLVPPVSKSDAQRALVIAHLLDRREPAAFLREEPREDWPEDLAVLERGLEALRRGAGEEWTEIDCGAGGTPFRFLVTQAALSPGCRARFTGTPRLGERPHQPLLDELHRALGARVEAMAGVPRSAGLLAGTAPEPSGSDPRIAGLPAGTALEPSGSDPRIAGLPAGTALEPSGSNPRIAGLPAGIALEPSGSDPRIAGLPAGTALEPSAPGQRGPIWPVEVEAADRPADTPHFRIEAGQSSQFASSLLLGAAALVLRERRPWTLTLEGELASPGYLQLTERWLEACGFVLAREGASIVVQEWRAPLRWPQVPGDWSSIGYLLLAAWRTGGEVARVGWETEHPDRALVRILRELGLTVSEGTGEGKGARVRGAPQRGLVATASECPDLMPTLAALSCVLPGESVLQDVAILRAKESDRLAGIQELVASAGGRTVLEPSSRLHIEPPRAVRERFAYDSRGDHRLAMAAATLALLSGAEIELTDPECVAKSFPGFWTQVRNAGLETRTLP